MKMATLAFDLGTFPRVNSFSSPIQLFPRVWEIIIDPLLSLSVRDKNKSPIIYIIASVCSLKCLFWVWDCGAGEGLEGVLLPTTKVIPVSSTARAVWIKPPSHLLFPPSTLNWPTRIPSIPAQGEAPIDDPLCGVASRRGSLWMTRWSGGSIESIACDLLQDDTSRTHLTVDKRNTSQHSKRTALDNIKTTEKWGGDAARADASAPWKSLETLIIRTASQYRPDYFSLHMEGIYSHCTNDTDRFKMGVDRLLSFWFKCFTFCLVDESQFVFIIHHLFSSSSCLCFVLRFTL